jgi:hypothetical protein
MKKGMVWKGVLLVSAAIGGLFTVSYLMPLEHTEEVVVTEMIPESFGGTPGEWVEIEPILKGSVKSYKEFKAHSGQLEVGSKPPTAGHVTRPKRVGGTTNRELQFFLMSQQSRIEDQTVAFNNRQKVIEQLLD